MIVADPGIFQFVKERAPELPLHISTQANVSSWLSVKFWESQGACWWCWRGKSRSTS
ncbi:MAG: U32 family peptidase [Paracoccaceae bacterium]